ncbi:hypothetical protein [Epilithonimonas arachidiradicis]|uniref:Uncharacterized protein n=1 Tax=Epilithonimonas arachidiradicis TaxID=1617282 RepID=A0A420D9Q6_9FLAO|nr:hypothetical protein [Epilithonimonas arachidiradicis]RKE87690.1 hypothetical protein BXY58_1821 [Epilithonimonas arachidiradicis]GGG57168.1 hypothetical protein GCM10007332_18580 [Epilithonimonas arachidiradicis]
MSSAELQLKLDIINRITELKEIRVIKEIKKLLDFELDEEIFELSKQQQDRIAEARKEYTNGEVSSDEEVKKEIEKWLNEK